MSPQNTARRTYVMNRNIVARKSAIGKIGPTAYRGFKFAGVGNVIGVGVVWEDRNGTCFGMLNPAEAA